MIDAERRSTSGNPAVSSLATSCFTQYFLGGNIPQDLEINFNDTQPSNLKYICQTRDNNFAVYYYATLFDEKYGVPVYSGYKISQSDGVNIDRIPYTQRPSSNSWQTTPGEYKLFVNLICNPESDVRSQKSSYPNALATPQVWRFHELTMERENQSV